MPGNHLQFFPWENPNADSFYYLLMLPKGHPGWSLDLTVLDMTTNRRVVKRNGITPREYAAAIIAHRPKYFHSVNNMGRLFQEYVVEYAVKIHSYQIRAIRSIQTTKLRVTEYSGLHKYVTWKLQQMLRAESNPDWQKAKIGRMVVLPGSFPGSARDMHRRYWTQWRWSAIRRLARPTISSL